MLGGALLGTAVRLFLIPNGIAPAGVSGIAVLLNRFIPLNTGFLVLLLNIPLYLLGSKRLGTDFVVRSLAGTVSSSIALDHLPIAPPVTGEPILGAVYGGILTGVGLGLAFKSAGSTGGTDIVAKLLAQAYPTVSIGNYVMALDVLVIVLNGALGENSAFVVLYSIICMYISSIVIDVIQNGVKSGKAYNIITTNGDEIAAAINKELGRGVTKLGAVGAYTKRDYQMLVCIVLRSESARVLNIVRGYDKNAFIFTTDAREINGLGFNERRQ